MQSRKDNDNRRPKKSDLDSVDWDDVVPRLKLYTVGALRKFKLITLPDDESPLLGKNADDYVTEAVKKTLSGKRHWKPEKGSMYTFLIWVIRGMITNDIDKAVNRPLLEYADVHNDPRIIELESRTGDPEQDAIAGEEFRRFLKFIDDPDIRSLAIHMLVLGCSKTNLLSPLLNKSCQDIENLKKRLRRCVKNFSAGGDDNAEEKSNA